MKKLIKQKLKRIERPLDHKNSAPTRQGSGDSKVLTRTLSRGMSGIRKRFGTQMSGKFSRKSSNVGGPSPAKSKFESVASDKSGGSAISNSIPPETPGGNAMPTAVDTDAPVMPNMPLDSFEGEIPGEPTGGDMPESPRAQVDIAQMPGGDTAPEPHMVASSRA